MTIDFWGLGLQAVNVLILMWLLSHVFWRPVAAAIAKRQDTATSLIDASKATQAKADRALEEATQARAGIAAERSATLDAAQKEAATATKATLTEARVKADAMLATAKTTIVQDRDAAQKANEAQAADLAMKIAAKLLERLNCNATQSAFLSQLTEAIAKIPPADLTAVLDDPKGIEIVTATALGAEQSNTNKVVQTALGGKADLKFSTDPDLIGGLELRSPHFVLHNSWQADLKQIQKAVRDAT
ncbi:F-type H+-transporting ATPase subunit b [Yoonia maritima]|uniref:ATP synthase subunit b n=1 Tax=Yoonia maritima TaxID=1435347 RepID=A0A2T0W4X8_9RHOB|nr:F0F1 ATP synthase subunit delta [Yoonia maritima]PRY80534.1 F-type H+-transporting ATPase subunit b [Yoonia maritima]